MLSQQNNNFHAKALEEEPMPMAVPRFGITDSELAEIDRCVRQLQLFDSQLAEVRAHFAEQRANEAQNRYIANPTAETFESYKNAAIDFGCIDKFVLPVTFLATIEGTRENFARQKLLPVVRPILDRNIATLRRELSAIAQAEDALHRQMFGTPAAGNSAKIAAAQARIDELESIQRLAAVDPTNHRHVSSGAIEKIVAYLEQLPLVESAGAPSAESA